MFGVSGLLQVVNSSTKIKNELKHLVENGIKNRTVDRLYEEKPKYTSTSTE